jgi:hypothetical protein
LCKERTIAFAHLPMRQSRDKCQIEANACSCSPPEPNALSNTCSRDAVYMCQGGCKLVKACMSLCINSPTS